MAEQNPVLFLAVLVNDVDQHLKNPDGPLQDDGGFWHRSLIRSFFGLVEALTSFSRRHYIQAVMKRIGKDHFKGISEDDFKLFKNLVRATNRTEWVVQDNGKPQEKNRKIGFKANFKACVRMLYLCHARSDAEATKLLEGEGVQALMRVNQVRDGLMHPHSMEDVTISSKTIDDVGKATDLIKKLLEVMMDGFSKLPPKQ